MLKRALLYQLSYAPTITECTTIKSSYCTVTTWSPILFLESVAALVAVASEESDGVNKESLSTAAKLCSGAKCA